MPDAFSTGRPDKQFKARIIPRKRRSRRRQRSDAKRALVAVSKLSRMLVQPKQYLDTTVSTPLATTWTFTNITPVAEGDDIGGRTGREISVTLLNMRGGIASDASSTAPQRVRIVIFIDYENRGAAPGATDVFASDQCDALTNLGTQNMGRFRFVYDRYFRLNKGSASGEENVPFTFNKKLKHRIQFTGNLSTDEGKGCMYWGICTDSVAGATGSCTCFTRVWFVE